MILPKTLKLKGALEFVSQESVIVTRTQTYLKFLGKEHTGTKIHLLEFRADLLSRQTQRLICMEMFGRLTDFKNRMM